MDHTESAFERKILAYRVIVSNIQTNAVIILAC